MADRKFKYHLSYDQLAMGQDFIVAMGEAARVCRLGFDAKIIPSDDGGHALLANVSAPQKSGLLAGLHAWVNSVKFGKFKKMTAVIVAEFEADIAPKNVLKGVRLAVKLTPTEARDPLVQVDERRAANWYVDSFGRVGGEPIGDAARAIANGRAALKAAQGAKRDGRE